MKNVALLAIATLGIPFAIYLYAGFNAGLSPDAASWGHFGGYYGGVVGPVLTFLTLIFLAYQHDELAREKLKDEQWRYIEQGRSRIEAVLNMPISQSDRMADTLGSFVKGYRSYDRHGGMTVKVKREFLGHLFHFAAALDMYQRNFGAFMLYRPQAEDARKYFDWLMLHQDEFDRQDLMTLGFVGTHLGIKP